MRTLRAVCGALLASAILAALPPPASGGDRLEELWAAREELSKAGDAAAAFEAELALRPRDIQLLARGSRLHLWIGRKLEAGDRDRAESHFEAGKGLGQRLIDAAPDKAAGYVLKAENLARIVAAKGKVKGIIEAQEVRSLAEKGEALDRGYLFSGADRLMCNYYLRLLGILGGDVGRAVARGEAAVRAHPEYAGNRVCLAEAYFKDGRNEMARKQAELALGTPDNAAADAVPEQRLEKARAAALLSKIGK